MSMIGGNIASVLGYVPKSEEQASAKQVAQLKSQVSSLQSQITNLNGTISAYKSQITSLRSQISSLQSEITRLQNTITSDNSLISSLRSQITNLQNTITSDNSLISSLRSQITNLQNTITSDNSLISSLQSQIAKLKADAYQIVASPISSATSGIIPFTVGFASNIASTPLQTELSKELDAPSSIYQKFGGSTSAISRRFTGYEVHVTTGGLTGGSSQTYYAVITETGLPSGTTWGVTINGKPYTANTGEMAIGEISIPEPRGTYNYTVTPPSGYVAKPASGTITMSGNSNSHVSIAFTTTQSGSTTQPPKVSVAWSFGDGSTSTSQNPTHQYTSPGIFTPSVIMTATWNGKTYSRTFVLPAIVSSLRVPASINIGSAVATGNCNNNYTVTFLDRNGTPCAYSPFFYLGKNLVFGNGTGIGKTDVNGQAVFLLHQCVCGVSSFTIRSLLDPTVSATASGQPPC